ncbi:urease accessory protein UreD [Hoyosella subflava]|uniref:Putative urease accessory protein n=1 Tax=Hoyosella subflava (strain DSM 45089 / JCM 17490 / NBRC 109087 / DQS3-9A1) TaxID=443218 RepID=F6EPP6_HOYSD|nr:urease accessory protein UreD [Hoyosella subflava]AEF40525.1 Putative urease accessory protein [Hoyosella subflava DQS3-9A1]
MRTELVIDAEKGRSPRIRSSGGLAARITGPDTVHVIGTAMTPLGGDEISVRVTVGDGARLIVRSVAASVALPGEKSVRSASNWMFGVKTDGYLDWEPEPMIVAGRAEHDATTELDLAASATVRLRERVQIGRWGEHGLGFWRGTLSARVDTVPMVMHTLELGHGDVLGTPRALTSELNYPGCGEEVLIDESPGGLGLRVPLPLGGSLMTWTGESL